MSGLKHFFAEKAGDIAEDIVRKALGCGDKDDDKDDDNKKGGILSFFSGDKDEEKEKEKGGMFSFGGDKKKDDDDKGFFSKVFDKEDDDNKEKKSGFKGLFLEHGAAEGDDYEFGGESEYEGGFKGQSVAVSDGDLFDDLMDVAQETHEGK